MIVRPTSLWLAGLLEDLALFERVGDDASQARTLGRIARAAITLGHGSRAVRACRLGLAAAADPDLSGDLWGIAAHALCLAGHPAHATSAYARAEAIFRAAGRHGRAAAAATARAILVGARDPAAARAQLRAILDETVSAVEPTLLASALCALGEIDLQSGDATRAALCAKTAERALALANLPASADAASLAGRALHALGDLEAARAALESAVSRLGAVASPARRARALEALGWVHIDAGDRHSARLSLAQALHHARTAGDHLLVARVGLTLAFTHLDDNRAEAQRHLVSAIDSLTRSAAPPKDLLGRARELLSEFPQGGNAIAILFSRLDDLGDHAN